MRTVPAASSMSTAQSSRRSTSAMIDTSMMRGTLVNTVVPEVSNAAAMSFNTLFFAPTTETSPTSRAPPTTRNRSTTRSYPAGSAPAPDRPRRWVGSGKSYAGGTTALGDMSRTRKTSPRLAAYADVDEANSAIGVALALGELAADVTAVLTRVQNDLFDVGADLCTPVVAEPAYPPLRVTEAYITRLEQDCDVFNEHLDKLNSFILPGGSAGAALLHVARTITRRAERWTWVMLEAEPERTSPLPARYLNRLSDLLFILARTANAERGDVLWSPGAGSAGAPE